MTLDFQFADFAAFLWMKGHGPYVWGSYAVTFLGVLFLIVEPGLQKKKFIRLQQQAQKRQIHGAAVQASAQPE